MCNHFAKVGSKPSRILRIWLLTVLALGSAAAAQDTPESLLRKAEEAGRQTRETLKSASGTGTIQFTVLAPQDDEPNLVTDADIQVFFDAPKYHIRLTNVARRLVARGPEPQEASEVVEQAILFDGGETLYWVQFFQDGKCRGEIYFAFSQQSVLRKAGLPLKTPIYLWNEALDIGGLDLSNTRVTSLAGGGLVGEVTKSRYRIKFFFLGDFGYDLRRVSSFRTGQRKPFRDHILTWDQSNGAHYVKRYSHSVLRVPPDAQETAESTSRQEQFSIEYDSFEANVIVAPNVFSLDALKIPSGTVFLDRRVHVRGEPLRKIYDGRLLAQPTAE